MTRGDGYRYALALSVTLSAAMTMAKPAAAIPAFARREGVQCVTCHSTPPALNAAGRTYLRNGYRWSGADGLPFDWRRQFPGALQINSTAGATPERVSTYLATAQYFAAGRLRRDISMWIDGTLPRAGLTEVGQRNRFFVVLGNPSRQPWRVRIGDFDPPMDNKPSTSLGLSAPALYFRGSANGYAPGQVQRGVELAHLSRDWSLGLFGGKGRRIGFTGNANGDEFGDWAGWMEYRPSGDWVLTGYVYLGRLSTFIPTRIYEEKMGQALVAARYSGARWEALAGAAYGHHRNAKGDGFGLTSRGVYLEGRWFPRPLAAVFGRLDLVDAGTIDGEETLVTFGISHQWKRLPLRTTAEMVQSDTGESRLDALLQMFF